MKSRFPRMNLLTIVLAVGLVCSLGIAANPAIAQEPMPGSQGGNGQKMPVFGKITALTDRSIEITNVDGEKVTIKLTDKTEFRKDRQAAKRSDFKVGDVILVRGEENADHSWTAQVIAARSMNGPGGPGGGRGGVGGQGGRDRGEFARQVGTQGKDFVSGEIKSVDAPKLAVLRTDNVTQTIELNEDTSLRKGREAITMADIQPGDHVFARGGLENNAFVPKTVVIIGPEQWKRMQEWSGQGGGQRRRGAGGPGAGAAPAAGSGDASTGGANPQKPAEPQN
jgi:preprotein translocase subunit YajC